MVLAEDAAAAHKMKMQKNTIYGLLIFLAIVVIGFFMIRSGTSKPTDNGGVVDSVDLGDIQEVVLSMKNYNYYPSAIRIKSGKPVKLSLDNTVYGCFRNFVIKGISMQKYMATSQDFLEFTIDQPGTYPFTCGMGMGSGKFIVE